MAEVKKKVTTKKTTVKVSKPTKTVAKKAEVKVSKPVTKTASKSRTEEKNASTTTKGMVDKELRVSASSLKVQIVNVDGTSKGNMTLPSEVFGANPNKILIAQAVRVYLANQRQGNASTKTRSEVVGSTRKIYRQKGTGRARHGALKAPIFVGGGIAFGPRPHDFSMEFPKKMRRQALISALSEKAQAGFVKVVEGEFSGKTKEVANLIKSLGVGKKGKADKVLFVTDDNVNAVRGAHNIDGLELQRASTLSTYGVVVNKNVVFSKSAIDELAKRLAKN